MFQESLPHTKPKSLSETIYTLFWQYSEAKQIKMCRNSRPFSDHIQELFEVYPEHFQNLNEVPIQNHFSCTITVVSPYFVPVTHHGR